MPDLGKRIAKRAKSTYAAFKTDCSFSAGYGLLRILDELGGRVGLKAVSAWAHQKKDRWILDYLKTGLAPVLEKYRGMEDGSSAHLPPAPIWVCWWTGEETAPALVRQCIASIRANANSHPVNMITQENYGEFLDIPEHILRKMESGQMCVANFTDYLRFSLLEKYGGLWLDATIFCSGSVCDEMFELPLFTCKSPPRETKYISQYRWTSFCFGGHCGELLFRFMHDAFELYWEKNNAAIDYLLVDYLIELAYSEVPAIKERLDKVPYNNLHRDDLQAAMNAALPASAFGEILQPDTTLYKLSWRESYLEQSADGTESVYSFFLKKKVF